MRAPVAAALLILAIAVAVAVAYGWCWLLLDSINNVFGTDLPKSPGAVFSAYFILATVIVIRTW